MMGTPNRMTEVRERTCSGRRWACGRADGRRVPCPGRDGRPRGRCRARTATASAQCAPSGTRAAAATAKSAHGASKHGHGCEQDAAGWSTSGTALVLLCLQQSEATCNEVRKLPQTSIRLRATQADATAPTASPQHAATQASTSGLRCGLVFVFLPCWKILNVR